MAKYNLTGLILMVFLSGCSGSASFNELEAQENMLVRTKNYPGLIDFYKSQLKESELSATRAKLAQAYLDYGDPDSALFTITPLTQRANEQTVRKKQPNTSTWDMLTEQVSWERWGYDEVDTNWLFIQANAELAMGKSDAALSSALQAFQMNNQDAEIANLIGVVYAGEGNIYEARHYFHLARKNLYDDVKVKNNLALLYLLEGKFERAIDMLLPLYVNGQADEKVEANLVLALVKNGDINLMRKVLKPQYSDRDIAQKYQALNSVQPAKWIRAFNGDES
ncbi:Flp pilus assembly protein TadD, contains TPR repeat [Vibrio owensii]|uniref:Flp pilus assembly protein TadD, contains TPR repeat n=1 Tax=Vibrio owensii TaxID=696485 RepID=A0AAU9QA39_9VIBR|nr:Flp pilus assembly protein TadD, contains TPR repeat [Vibrio owensii]